MVMKRKTINRSTRPTEDIKLTEAKFARITAAFQKEFGETAPMILYTPDGVIMAGSPLALLATYAQCDEFAQEQLEEAKKMAGEELIDRILNGDAPDCGDPDCRGHEDTRRG